MDASFAGSFTGSVRFRRTLHIAAGVCADVYCCAVDGVGVALSCACAGCGAAGM